MREYGAWLEEIYLFARLTGTERLVLVVPSDEDDIVWMMEDLRQFDRKAAMMLAEFIVL